MVKKKKKSGKADKAKEGGIEKRKFHRIDTHIETPYWKYIKFKHRDQVHIGFVKNMSRGGIFIETQEVYQVQEEVGFEFFLPNSSKPISGIAQVKWRRTLNDAKGTDEVSGMGVQFLEFQGDSEEILETFIRKGMKKK